MAGPRPFGPALFLLFILFHTTHSSDVTILLSFKATISDPAGSLRDWSANSEPCTPPTWAGVICASNGAVFGLQLENMNLLGQLRIDMLTALPVLRTLSFANNSFDGPMPDLKKFKGLKSVFLSMNKLAGEIPDDAFEGMGSLKKVDLSRNGFSGRIPGSLVGVGKLLELRMEDNGFEGEIPDFRQSDLRVVNVSNNDLEGRIPDGLSKMDASMFAGNKALCGPPLGVQCKLLASPPPSLSSPTRLSNPSSSPTKLSTPLIVGIAVIGVGVVLAIIGGAFAVLRQRPRSEKNQMGQPEPFLKPKKVEPIKVEKAEQGGSDGGGSRKKTIAPTKEEKEQGGLVFVRQDRKERFELQDLLRASAEVLGSGVLGSSYKALLQHGPSVVVKRFKEMNRLGKDEFQEHMRRLGRLSHPNLLPLVAYYFRREEKLLVTDYIPYGSLASLLHDDRSSDNSTLDWPKRLKIVKGIARGLAYLYEELSMLNVPHGHLKSSNVLLDSSYEPLLMDYALTPVMNQAHASQTMIAYKSPEFKQYGKIFSKTDVWSFGVLILEILTGKTPGNYSRQARGGSDLASWVNSVVREEWTGEVFDGKMRRTRNGEEEMLNLLQIGLGCCEADVEKRWELKEALEKIEELKERDGDEDYSSFLSEGEVYSSRAMTEDEFSFSANN